MISIQLEIEFILILVNYQLKLFLEGMWHVLCIEKNPKHWLGTLEGKFEIEVHVCTCVKQPLHGQGFDLLLKCRALEKFITVVLDDLSSLLLCVLSYHTIC